MSITRFFNMKNGVNVNHTFRDDLVVDKIVQYPTTQSLPKLKI